MELANKSLKSTEINYIVAMIGKIFNESNILLRSEVGALTHNDESTKRNTPATAYPW